MGLWEKFGSGFKNDVLSPNIPVNTKIQSCNGKKKDFGNTGNIGIIYPKNKKPSSLSILRKAGLVPVLAGDSFEVLGLENLPEDRREKCRQYCRVHEREILQELRNEAWFQGGFHLAWFRDVGLDLSQNDAGQVVWAVRQGWEKFWDVRPGALPTRAAKVLPADCEWQCWLYACKHRREIMAVLEPCKGWKPSQPSEGCTTLEEFNNELEKERRRGVVTFCPFLDMWICRKDCPKWCGRWNEPLTSEERKYWAALWEKKTAAA